MKNTAVIIGATGAVGREILKEILGSEYYERVYVLGRNSITSLPNEERLAKTSAFSNILVSKLIFSKSIIIFVNLSSLGKLCEGKVRSFNIVSAIGANSKSKNFYNSLKGELEDKLKEMNLGTLRIFQPSLLISKREDKRFLEEIFMKVAPIFQFVLKGKTKKYSPIEASLLGKEMVRFAVDYKDRGTYTYNDF